MRLHILVEGPAEQALLRRLVPRLLPNHPTPKIIVHEGKGKLPRDFHAPLDPARNQLLSQLPAKLRAFGKTFDPQTDRVLVLVDADDDDCRGLKARLVEMYDHCVPRPTALFRIAVRETETFYLGDRKAIVEAFPEARPRRISARIEHEDGGTWEMFQKVIGAQSVAKVVSAAPTPSIARRHERARSASWRMQQRGPRELQPGARAE